MNIADTLKLIHPRSLKYLSDHLQTLIQGKLWLKVLLSMAAGILVGILIGPGVGMVDPARAAVMGSWLALPGQIFLGLVQMIVVPLIFCLDHPRSGIQ